MIIILSWYLIWVLFHKTNQKLTVFSGNNDYISSLGTNIPYYVGQYFVPRVLIKSKLPSSPVNICIIFLYFFMNHNFILWLQVMILKLLSLEQPTWMTKGSGNMSCVLKGFQPVWLFWLVSVAVSQMYYTRKVNLFHQHPHLMQLFSVAVFNSWACCVSGF